MKLFPSLILAGAGILAPILGTAGEDRLKKGITYDFSYVHMKADLNKNLTTVPVHPQDAGFLSGDTPVELGSDWELAVTIGGELEYPLTDILSLKGGLEGRLNCSSNKYRGGYYEVKKQISDTRPGDNASFCFAQLYEFPLSFVPSASINLDFEKFGISLGAEFPYTKYTAKSGWDRFGEWETANKEKWTGFSRALVGKLYFGDKNAKFAIGFRDEKVDMEDMGNLRKKYFLIGFEATF